MKPILTVVFALNALGWGLWCVVLWVALYLPDKNAPLWLLVAYMSVSTLMIGLNLALLVSLSQSVKAKGPRRNISENGPFIRCNR